MRLGAGLAAISASPGDLETVLIAPYARPGLPFVLGFSDGSLIEGKYDAETGRHAFRGLVDGAGIVTIEQADDNEVAVLNWSVEWVTIAPMSGVMMRDHCVSEDGVISALGDTNIPARPVPGEPAASGVGCAGREGRGEAATGGRRVCTGPARTRA